jgi:hypothetical protein
MNQTPLKLLVSFLDHVALELGGEDVRANVLNKVALSVLHGVLRADAVS